MSYWYLYNLYWNLSEAAITQEAINKEKKIITDTTKIIAACDYISMNYDHIELDDLTRQEKSAVDCYQIIKPFLQILKLRLIVEAEYVKTKNAFDNI